MGQWHPIVDEAQALEIARQRATILQWPWHDTAQATLRINWRGDAGRWEVHSRPAGRGAMVRVVIDATTGAVLDEGHLPR